MKDYLSDTLYAYEKSPEHYVKKFDENGARTKEVEAFVKLAPGNRILEIGCGYGRDAGFPIENGFNYTGIDFSEELLKKARQKYQTAKFIKMDMRNLQFLPESFDGIYAFASLVHLSKADCFKVLKRIYNILAKGGIAHLEVKYGKGEEDKVDSAGTRHFSYYTLGEFSELAKKAGFTITEEKIVQKGQTWIYVIGRKY